MAILRENAQALAEMQASNDAIADISLLTPARIQ